MEFYEIAEKLGFESYPQALDEVFAAMPKDDSPACDLQLIDRLQADMDLFGSYYQLVRQTAEEINKDPVRSVWVKVAAKYAYDNPIELAQKVPTPKSDGTAVTDLLPLHIILPQMPAAIEEYYRRGFCYAEVKELMKDFQGSIAIVESQVGRPCVNALYYGWLHNYSKVEIFATNGFWFELDHINPKAMWLRHRKTGEILCVVCRGTFDGTGSQLKGSKYYEDPVDTFTVTLTEDDEKFVGHGVYDNKVSPVAKTYLKSEWACIARPGDKCMSIHIPRGGNISLDVLDAAVASARKIATERFPDKAGMQIHGSSWLLDPKIGEILGPDARMTQFMKRFVVHPQWSQGDNVFGYVFPKNYTDYESLPEDTALQRKLKKLYMDGSCIYSYAGIMQ